jgi:hypothetical protein
MNFRHQLGTLVVRLPEEEWAARKAAGLPEHHVLSADEFPLRYARATLDEILELAAEWKRQEPNERLAALVLSQAQIIAGQYVEADATLADYQRLTGDAMGAMRYAAPIARPVHPLPPVVGTWPRGPAFFISCDAKYWKLFGVPLARSIAHRAPGAPVHAHLMSPDVDVAGDLKDLPLALTTTSEDPAPFLAATGCTLANYCSAVRLVRFSEALDQATGPLCIMDADALAYRDPLSVFDIDGDLALRARAGRFEAVHHFSACLIVARAGARPYFRCVADIIRGFIHAPWWGLDQYALHRAYIMTAPQIRFLGPEWADTQQSHEGVFWFTAGKAKQRLKTDDTAYARLFRQYWR